MRVIYHPEAAAEVAEAAHAYRGISQDLGERFLRAFDDAVAGILKSPGLWPEVDEGLRCRTLGRFPYSIYYRAVGGDLEILVFKHHRRHPDYWKHRLDG